MKEKNSTKHLHTNPMVSKFHQQKYRKGIGTAGKDEFLQEEVSGEEICNFRAIMVLENHHVLCLSFMITMEAMET